MGRDWWRVILSCALLTICAAGSLAVAQDAGGSDVRSIAPAEPGCGRNGFISDDPEPVGLSWLQDIYKVGFITEDPEPVGLFRLWIVEDIDPFGGATGAWGPSDPCESFTELPRPNAESEDPAVDMPTTPAPERTFLPSRVVWFLLGRR